MSTPNPIPTTSSTEAEPSLPEGNPVVATHDSESGEDVVAEGNIEALVNEFLADDSDGVAVSVAEPTKEPEPAPQSEAPAQEPVAAVEAPPAEPVVEQPPTTPVEAAPTWDPAAAMEKLATDFYKLTDEEVKLVEEEPAKALPQMAARVHMAVLQSTMSTLATYMPQIIETVQRSTRVQQEAEEAFYKAWPTLKDAKYADDLRRVADLYVQMNPNSDLETRIRDIGAQLHFMHRLPLPAQNATAPAAEQPRPYVPPRGGPAAAPVRTSGNQFEVLAEEFMQED